jgi:hemolysin activation/secretion protein
MTRIGAMLAAGACLAAAQAAGGGVEGAAASALQPQSPQLSSGVAVKRIRFVGNTVFSAQTLRAVVMQFENRSLRGEDLESLRQKLTRFYVDAGYVNSGATIPAQSVADGVLEVRITEGRLTDVKISGEHHYYLWYLTPLLMDDRMRPLNVNELQERMQLLLQDGVVEQINAQLQPGDAPGQSILTATVREGPRFKLSMTLADDRPPIVGETGGTVALSGRNLLGVDDAGVASVGLTSGYRDYSLQESVPILTPSLSLFVRGDRNHGSIVESSIAELGVVSRETSAELGMSAQLVHSLRQSVTASFSYYYSDTRTFLLGIPFSFSPGAVDGHSRVTALRYALDWTYRGDARVFAARSVVDVGFPAFGATEHLDSDLPDSHFVAWNAQLQYVQQVLDRSGEFVGRTAFQLASKGLLPSETFAVGGVDTVRGYATNTLVRDEGAAASLEYRQRLTHLRVPGLARDANDGVLALAAFYDLGMANDRYGPRTWIAGTGAGLRWALAPNCSAFFYKGVALHRVSPHDGSLQDQGIHFRVAYETGL